MVLILYMVHDGYIVIYIYIVMVKHQQIIYPNVYNTLQYYIS